MIIRVIDVHRYHCVDRSYSAPCTGSFCMAWRWSDTRRMYGFCGLAGVPMSKTAEPLQKEE